MQEMKDVEKPVVVMYYTYGDRIGGPLTYINTIANSELSKKYDFRTCFQGQGPRGLNLVLLKAMVKKLRLIKPDIVHVHGAQSEGFYGVLAAKFAGCKHVVMTIHGFAHDDFTYKGVKRFLYKNVVEPLSIRLADQVYCVCEYASQREIVKRNAGKRNCGYIHNPIPELKVIQSRSNIRAAYGIKDDDVLFCIASRLTRDKGFDLLSEIVKEINRNGIEHFRLMVLGDGDYAPQFRKALQKEIENGQVIMVGRTDDVASYLSASEAFIFPSYHENLSIALLEACASGLPCVVGNVGGNSEIIIDGKNGFVLDEHNAKAFTEKIEQLIGDRSLLEGMQRFAKRDIQERFSQEMLFQKIDEVYSIDTKQR